MNNFKSLFIVARYTVSLFVMNNSRSLITSESIVGPGSVQTPHKTGQMYAPVGTIGFFNEKLNKTRYRIQEELLFLTEL